LAIFIRISLGKPIYGYGFTWKYVEYGEYQEIFKGLSEKSAARFKGVRLKG
jgi:hypothetical protein